jgi:cell division initiation protein
MGLTPLDIHNKEFSKKFLGGYNTNAVDEFLDQVIREFEALIKENAHLKEQVEAVDLKLAQYRNLEETINNTLVVSQGVAEDLKANAKKESDLIIQEARLQAERIIEAGRPRLVALLMTTPISHGRHTCSGPRFVQCSRPNSMPLDRSVIHLLPQSVT